MKKIYTLLIFLLISFNVFAADEKISELVELSEPPAIGDFIPLVDISDTSQAASGSTKRVSSANLLYNINSVMGTLYGDVSFGTFTGITIPDNATVVQALQALETALELRLTKAAADLIYQPIWDYDYTDLINKPTIVDWTSDQGATNININNE